MSSKRTEQTISYRKVERLCSTGELLKVCCHKFKAHPSQHNCIKYNAYKADGICVTGSAVLPLQFDGRKREQRNRGCMQGELIMMGYGTQAH